MIVPLRDFERLWFRVSATQSDAHGRRLFVGPICIRPDPLEESHRLRTFVVEAQLTPSTELRLLAEITVHYTGHQA